MTPTAEDTLSSLIARVAKVRRWLVALAVLRVAALSVVFVSAYIGAYAWIDHRFHFSHLCRVIALALLLVVSALLVRGLVKALLRHVSYTRAANHIENRMSFEQQLVAAVEFYEQGQAYPYSKALARQLVLRLDKASSGFRFDSAVAKWRGYALAGVILVCLSFVGVYVGHNVLYFSSYFARLARPLAVIDPLPSMSLESITTDVIAEPNSPVTLAAQIRGNVPKSARLALTDGDIETASTSNAQQGQRTEILPVHGQGGPALLEISRSFAQVGRHRYRFEAGSAHTPWHEINICVAPQIESITATVQPPARPGRDTPKAYTQEVQNQTLEVVPYSTVTLAVQTSGPLKEAAITGPNGKPIGHQLKDANLVTTSFTADRNGQVAFSLVSDEGLKAENLPGLQVMLKFDEPPQLRLVSPEGDYLATDVASVPVTFEATDDYGLDSVHIYFEMPDREPNCAVSTAANAAKSAEISHVLELEQYNLSVGDSILFYAKATDIDTGSWPEKRTGLSDVYFIEIKSYRQHWHPKPGGGSGGGAPIETLLNVLEYTRAIVKKTWTVAGKSTLTDEDRSVLEAVDNDVRYCAEVLAEIRDDPEYGFSDSDKSTLNEVLTNYDQAGRHLRRHKAPSALVPAKDAYRILRRFVDELELEWTPPSSGQGQQPKKPESVKLAEPPEFSHYEKERVESELKRLKQKLEMLTKKQKRLKRDFTNLLEQQSQQSRSAQEADSARSASASTDAQASSEGTAGQQAAAGRGQPSTDPQRSPDKARSSAPGPSADPNSGKGDSARGDSQSGSTRKASQSGDSPGSQGAGEDGAAGDDGSSGDNSSSSSSQSAGAGKGRSGSGSKGQGADESQGRGRGKGSSGSGRQEQGGSEESAGPGQPGGSPGKKSQRTAGTDSRLRMLQARQKALREDAARLNAQLGQVPTLDLPDHMQGRNDAAKHLDQAIARMDELDDKLTQTQYEPDMAGQEGSEAGDLAEQVTRELAEAQMAIDRGLARGNQDRLAQDADEIAEQLAEDADALDGSVSAPQRREMLARLEAAKRLLESMAGPQWATVNRGGGSPGAAHVFTRSPNMTPAEAARMLARQFWSLSVNAKKNKPQSVEDEPSDARFFELENEFFEDLAGVQSESLTDDIR